MSPELTADSFPVRINQKPVSAYLLAGAVQWLYIRGRGGVRLPPSR